MQASDARYFDGTGGFLVLGTSLTGGSQIMRVNSWNLDYSISTEDLLSFDDNFNVGKALGTTSWSISCEAYFTQVSGDTTSPNSGSTYVTGGYAGSQVLNLAKSRATNLYAILKAGNIIQRGPVVITSYSMGSSSSEVMTYQLELSGNGALTTILS
jgi:hypothetical protein